MHHTAFDVLIGTKPPMMSQQSRLIFKDMANLEWQMSAKSPESHFDRTGILQQHGPHAEAPLPTLRRKRRCASSDLW